MENSLWRFTDNQGSFESFCADKVKSLYFPLGNENFLSSVSADLHGDIKRGNDSFLLQPVSRIDLTNLKSSRNFWIYIDKNKIWSAAGASKNLKQIQADKFKLEAGLLWQKIERENKAIGLKSEILSFVPATGEPIEIMQVKITNTTPRKIKFTPTAAIPVYARGASNLRDHRQVTSLLQRITLHKFGVISKPTLSFDESGHKPNKTSYFVLGWDEKFSAPEYLYPTQDMFCGDEGDLESPASVLNNSIPQKEQIQGKEPMGGLRFRSLTLAAGESRTYIILMGITEDSAQIKRIINNFKTLKQLRTSFEKTKDFWISRSQQINLSTGDADFDNWFRWVSIQPMLRKIFGCSFLPDFDYGKGGRGWRDLWQDCLGLILSEPLKVRSLLINNFSGIRIDGSNATIIGKKPGEFIADRNDIARVWMDHGVWPLITLDLYMQETGDFDILFEQTTYFRDQHIFRSAKTDKNWKQGQENRLTARAGKAYKGTILEHLLVQSLVQFFNVGSHNHVRLEGADWNDGLDMAKENGESVAFSAMYAHNLSLLARLLENIDREKIEVAEELKILLSQVNYHNIKAKLNLLENYFRRVSTNVSGKKISLNSAWLADNLMTKSEWMASHIRNSEWLKQGFFNGYYDNLKRRVEGKRNNHLRMTLTGQVFPVMSGVAAPWQVSEVLKSVKKHLFNKKLKGFHLNTDFKKEQHNLGRAFSFNYGDKENGAFFNHMIVMYAYALYRRGLASAGWEVLSSIYKMALDTRKSKIYPCLPEYFNLEGRGMYSYLTGSASWFVLTLLTQAFGVRGKDGDLFIEPKLTAGQFGKNSTISINRVFAGRKLQINFSNPKKLSAEKYKIARIALNSRKLESKTTKNVLIERKIILGLPKDKINKIDIVLG